MSLKAISSRGTSILHQRHRDPVVPRGKHLVVLFLIGSLLMAMTGAFVPPGALAAPDQASAIRTLNQNVDYLGPDNAARLNLEFPVLVPSYVPGPFSGEPAVDAGGGYYSLYWMTSGGAPTFLQITGLAGGGLPAGSPYDLNVQLSVNASVQGYDAIHDVTPAYDAVWWIAGGVLYKVESLNMETDSLSLANSLIGYVGPEAPDVESPPDPGNGVPDAPTDVPESPGEAIDSGVQDIDESVVPGQATEEAADENAAGPDVTVEAEARPTIDAQGAATVEVGVGPAVGDPALETTSEAIAVPTDTPDTERSGSVLSSDGTGGAPLPVFGGDGTGGTRDIVVPDPDE